MIGAVPLSLVQVQGNPLCKKLVQGKANALRKSFALGNAFGLPPRIVEAQPNEQQQPFRPKRASTKLYITRAHTLLASRFIQMLIIYGRAAPPLLLIRGEPGPYKMAPSPLITPQIRGQQKPYGFRHTPVIVLRTITKRQALEGLPLLLSSPLGGPFQRADRASLSGAQRSEGILGPEGPKQRVVSLLRPHGLAVQNYVHLYTGLSPLEGAEALTIYSVRLIILVRWTRIM